MQDGSTCDDVDECEVFRRVWAGPLAEVLSSKPATSSSHQHSMIECSQYCTNKKGTYKCTCAEGYRLDEDRVTCRLAHGQAELLLSTGIASGSSVASGSSSALEVLSLGSLLTSVKSLPVRVSGLNVTAVDSDARAKKIYWVEGEKQNAHCNEKLPIVIQFFVSLGSTFSQS
jgi:hypothetical protein